MLERFSKGSGIVDGELQIGTSLFTSATEALAITTAAALTTAETAALSA